MGYFGSAFLASSLSFGGSLIKINILFLLSVWKLVLRGQLRGDLALFFALVVFVLALPPFCFSL